MITSSEFWRRRRLSQSSTLLLVIAFAATLTAQTKPSATAQDLDAYVARAMKIFQVPGLALAVVKDGQVVVAKGFRSEETQLAHGRLADGSRLFSEATWRELTTLVTPMPITDPPSPLAALRPNFRGYALGLDVRDYRGYKLLMHTGGLPGYVCNTIRSRSAGATASFARTHSSRSH